MKKNILFLIIVIISSFGYPAAADIYINEVLYNPLNTESGGEAVELYNSADDVVDISGYTLKTASYDNDASLPSGAIISSKGYYLIADSSWSIKKDSIMYPDADYEESITMQNANSGIALLDNNDVVVDKVGWGDAASVDQSLYSVKPANLSANGQSLVRVSFTDDNSLDFVSAEPELRNAKGESIPASTGYIDVIVDFNEISTIIKNLSVSYDFDDKVILSPGEEKLVKVSFQVDVAYELESASIIFGEEEIYFVGTRSSNNILYTALIPIPFYIMDGNYMLPLEYKRLGSVQIKNVTMTVLPLLAFELDLQSINCTMNSTRQCTVIGDEDMSTHDKPTLRNTGNQNLDFKIYASNLTGDGKSIDSRNIKLSFSDNSQLATEITNSPLIFDVNLNHGPESLLPLSLSVALPSEANSGKYTTRIVMLGVSNG